GVGIAQGHPDPERDDDHGNEKQGEENDEHLAMLLFDGSWRSGSVGGTGCVGCFSHLSSRSAGKGRCSRSDMHRSDQGISFQNHHTQADVLTVTRRSTASVMVGDIPIGSAYPIAGKSRTNTEPADPPAAPPR